MKKIVARIFKWIGLPGATIIIACVVLTWLLGCATNKQSGEVAAGTTGKGGAQLWAENCMRCHNIRSPGSLSPVQWEVAMMHMRATRKFSSSSNRELKRARPS